VGFTEKDRGGKENLVQEDPLPERALFSTTWIGVDKVPIQFVNNVLGQVGRRAQQGRAPSRPMALEQPSVQLTHQN